MNAWRSTRSIIRATFGTVARSAWRWSAVPCAISTPTISGAVCPVAVRALHDLLRRGHRVYVHCTAGINRSSLVVLAYLTLIEGASVEDAMTLMLRARPEVCPTWEACHGCRRDLTARHEDRIRQRAAEIGQRQPQRGALDHWLQAEREVWREVLTADQPSRGVA